MTLATFGKVMKYLNIMTRFLTHSRRIAQLALILLISGAAQLSQASSLESASVGEVSLVLGKAWLDSPDQGRRPAERAAKVYVHDRIVTAGNGYVHLKFVDQALVSVRPDSMLEIQRYDYDAQTPALSSVKFKLDEGVTRSISGDAAHSARERFRLNTPIAAIGVRGTDFVVSATNSSTQAMVNEGTIVLAPYSPECSADAFGPCIANAVELSGDSLQTLALNESDPLPRLVPSVNTRNRDMMSNEVAMAVAANSDQASAANQGEDTLLVASADTTPDDNGDVRTNSLEVVQEAVTTPQLTSDADAIADSQASAIAGNGVGDFTPVSALTYTTLKSRELIWGRFGFFNTSDVAQEDDRISVSFGEASINREVTIAGLGYTLFRRNLETENLQVDQSSLSFKLNSAQAFYSSDAGIDAMQVTGGRLDVDLAARQFATELNLDHSATGAIDFEANGSINVAGFFHGSSDSQLIEGALSVDGREAGYFFEQQLEEGGIQGLTLWDSL